MHSGGHDVRVVVVEVVNWLSWAEIGDPRKPTCNVTRSVQTKTSVTTSPAITTGFVALSRGGQRSRGRSGDAAEARSAAHGEESLGRRSDCGKLREPPGTRPLDDPRILEDFGCQYTRTCCLALLRIPVIWLNATTFPVACRKDMIIF